MALKGEAARVLLKKQIKLSILLGSIRKTLKISPVWVSK